MDITSLRKMRGANFSKINDALGKMANSGFAKDDRYWSLEKDKLGNGSAVIRFLPQVETDELPWVRLYSHGFQGPTGKWYIENSRTTLGEDDPVSASNSILWNSGEEGKELARKRKRRLGYISNIQVITDSKHPENEGKVFLFKYGKKIFDKIMDKANPAYDDVTPLNVFDPFDGANFKLRMRQKDGFVNYDDSEFMEKSEIAASDADILAVLKQCYELAPLVAPDQFKTYAELEGKLKRVLDESPAPTQSAEDMANKSAPKQRTKPAKAIHASASDSDDPDPEAQRSDPDPEPTASTGTPVDESEDSVMSYFNNLAKG